MYFLSPFEFKDFARPYAGINDLLRFGSGEVSTILGLGTFRVER